MPKSATEELLSLIEEANHIVTVDKTTKMEFTPINQTNNIAKSIIRFLSCYNAKIGLYIRLFHYPSQ